MTRSLVVISFALLVCVAVVTLSGPTGAPARTLEPQAVWSIFGGSQHGQLCCKVPSSETGCVWPDTPCDAQSYIQQGTPCYNRLWRDAIPDNNKLCVEYIGTGTCTQADEPEWHDCEVTKQCYEHPVSHQCISGAVLNTKRAPDWCTPSCT
jgi:hypothetical protein